MMSFTFTNYEASKPEQVSPWANLRHNITQAQNEQTRSKYLPKQLEADIIGKSVAPLAQIAASPLAAAMLPEQKEQMMNYISKIMQGSGGQQQDNQHEGSFGDVPVLGSLEKWITEHLGGAKARESFPKSQKTTPGFPTNEEIYEGLKAGSQSVLGAGGRGNALKSKIGVLADQAFGENPVSQYLGDNGKASAQKAAFEQTKKDLEQKLIREGRLAHDAHFIAQEQPGETAEQYLENRKKYLIPEERQPKNNYPTSDREMSVNINAEAHKLGVQPRYVTEAAEGFDTSPEIILGGLRSGVKSDEEMRDYIAGVKNGR